MLTSTVSNQVRKYGAKLSHEKRVELMDRIVALQNRPIWRIADFFASLFAGSNLRLLATLYLADKWNIHWYAQHYEALFDKIRHKKLNLLEIGVGGYDKPKSGGASLRMWRAYFPKGRIFGVDIYEKSFHDSRRIKTFQGSQVDPDFLDSVVRQIGQLDIIIDDGSHENEHVLFTFHRLFPQLAEGGYYAIEDTQTSYWPKQGGNAVDRNDLNTSMGYFKSLADGLNWEEYPGKYEPNYYDVNIKSIAFYHNLIIITKGSNRERGGRPQLQA